MTDKPIIGFIGLGLMGHGMAKNIRKAGYELWIKGRTNRAPIEDLLAIGAHEVENPRDMAEVCDIIHICVSTSEQVEQIVTGEDGILSAERPGLIVVDASTADPGSTMRLAHLLSERRMHMVDAPLGRTPKEAEEGKLDAMVGCEPAVFDKIRPVLDCWAATVTHVGPVGTGHKMKLLMNFIGLSYGALYSEAVVLGAKVGISPQTIRSVIGSSRMGNGFFETFMRYVVDRDRDAHKFTLANASKDVRYINNMALDAGVVNVMAAAANHYYSSAVATGRSSDYLPMLSDHVGALNGLDVAAEVQRSE